MAATISAGGMLPDNYHLKPASALGTINAVAPGPLPDETPHFLAEQHMGLFARFIVQLLQWFSQTLSIYPGFILLVILADAIIGRSLIDATISTDPWTL